MTTEIGQLRRREVLTMGSAVVALTMIPVSRSVGSTAPAPTMAAQVSDGTPLCLVSPDIARNLWRVRHARDEAIEAYRATGDVQAIKQLRLRARHWFGYSLGLEARNDRERRLFAEAGELLAQIEGEFAEVPWSEDTKDRFIVLRRWADAGGQGALL